jgi:hypothetical protein
MLVIDRYEAVKGAIKGTSYDLCRLLMPFSSGFLA